MAKKISPNDQQSDYPTTQNANADEIDLNTAHRGAAGDVHSLIDQSGIGVGDLVRVKGTSPLQLERLDRSTYVKATAANAVVADIQRGASQTISNATLTAITLGSENYDPQNWWESSTNPERVTVPSGEGGRRYRIDVTLSFDGDTSGRRQVALRKNGTTTVGRVENAPTSGPWTAFFSAYDTPADGDYYEIIVYQTSGGDLNTRSSTGQLPRIVVNRAREV